MKLSLQILTPALFALALLLAAQASHAEVDAYRLYLAERGDIPWQSLTPEEQKALKRHRGKWDSYSTERQSNMRQGAQRYLDLPPEKRRKVEEEKRHYEQLSPQERKRLRDEYRRRNR